MLGRKDTTKHIFISGGFTKKSVKIALVKKMLKKHSENKLDINYSLYLLLADIVQDMRKGHSFVGECHQYLHTDHRKNISVYT